MSTRLAHWLGLISSECCGANGIQNLPNHHMRPQIGSDTSMLFVVSLQIGCIALLACLALVLGGPLLAWSACLGGLIVIVPNALFAWHLNRVEKAESFPAAFMAGEALKIFLTIAMLVGLTRSGINFHWVMLVGAMVVAVKAPMLGWFFERQSPDRATEAGKS